MDSDDLFTFIGIIAWIAIIGFILYVVSQNALWCEQYLDTPIIDVPLKCAR